MLAARHRIWCGRSVVVDAFPFISVLFFGPTATPDSVRPQADAIRDRTLAETPDERRASETQVINSMVSNDAARPAVLKAALTATRTFRRGPCTTDGPGPRAESKNITAPTTVIHAYNKAFPVPAETADSWYAASYAGLKGVKLVRIEDSYHFDHAGPGPAFEAEGGRRSWPEPRRSGPVPDLLEAFAAALSSRRRHGLAP